MRALVQRVSAGRVEIDGECVGEIGAGMVILLGVTHTDTPDDVRFLAKKCVELRIFEDEAGKMNVNPLDAGAELLIVSQFTLYADCKSRRPGFTRAARPETAIPLYELVVQECRDRGFTVGTGVFGAEMQVYSQNDGPVTIILDTEKL